MIPADATSKHAGIVATAGILLNSFQCIVHSLDFIFGRLGQGAGRSFPPMDQVLADPKRFGYRTLALAVTDHALIILAERLFALRVRS